MRPLTCLLLVALAACAPLTPREIRSEGTRFTIDSRLPPAQAAACLGRAAEEHNGDWNAAWRTGGDGHYELLVSMAPVLLARGITHLVADIAPTGTGSTATLHVQPSMMDSIRDALLAAMRRDC